MQRSLVVLALTTLAACSPQAEEIEVNSQPAQILTCTGTRTLSSLPPEPAQLLLRFDEDTQSLAFWFERERTWGHSVMTESQSLEVRDDFLIWRASTPVGSRMITIDRVNGAIIDQDTVNGWTTPGSRFEGACTSQPESKREPISAEQRRF
nr:hypothetical protein [Brevundimonas diminuta]